MRTVRQYTSPSGVYGLRGDEESAAEMSPSRVDVSPPKLTTVPLDYEFLFVATLDAAERPHRYEDQTATVESPFARESETMLDRSGP